MKTPIYETSPGALMALMFPADGSRGTFVYCDLYTIELTSGPVLRYTTADQEVGYSQSGPITVWTSKAVRFDYEQSKATVHWKVGTDIDTWQVTVFPRLRDEINSADTYPDRIGTQPFLAACVGGMLDAAKVYVDRAYFPAWTTPSGTPISPVGVLSIFSGRIAQVDVGRSSAILNVNSHLELFTQQMPRNIYQAPCHHTLFDAGCQLLRGSYQTQGVVGAGSTRVLIMSSISAPPNTSGTYTLGHVHMVSGENAGFGRAVRTWTPGTFQLIAPFPFPIQAGDIFYAYPGCNKTLDDCAKFNNRLNFGGEPFIPAPEVTA